MTDEAALKRRWALLHPALRPTCEDPTKPSQQAVNGAFDSYVEGGKKDKKRPTPFGFSVLRHATEEQLLAAMPFVRGSHGMSDAQVQATLKESGERSQEIRRRSAERIQNPRIENPRIQNPEVRLSEP